METDQSKTSWTSAQVYIMSAICLLLGIAVGYLVRGAQPATVAATSSAAPSPDANGVPQQPSPEQMKRMADAKAAPLLMQLQLSPNDPQLLAELGNIYYDTQNYQDAIAYYKRSLALKEDPNVRTDMGTSFFYLGDSDTALAEFDRALKVNPKFENALLNVGIVKFNGKMDARGAITAWEQLLKQNPNHPRRADIEQMIAQAKKHENVTPGQKAKPIM